MTSLASTDGWVVLVAFPLDEVGATLGQLALIEALVTIVVVLLVAFVARRLVSLALRPLGAIELTAARIAAGDIDQRVAPANPRTEVGRLGTALNTMLGRIQAALTEREASEQRLRRLVTDASHELRTPLTSIRGYAELFRRGAGDRPEDLARAMRGIEDEAQRMAILVDELLLLARLDEGHMPPSADEDLVPIVRAAVEAARAVEPDRRIDLDVPATAVVRSDPVRLRQVIDNLLANVRVHTPRGSPARVTVRVSDERVRLDVVDSGPGLSEAARIHAFERFYRADPSRSRDSGGSGLGLAIVASIVQGYGGTIEVESEPGAGARFSVDLPLAASR
jgi:two-component system OmpR family sensor kinase